MTLIDTDKLDNGWTVETYYDEDPMSPRDADNLGTLAIWHRSYDLGDKSHEVDVATAAMDRWGSYALTARYLRMFHGATVVLKVGMLDHSGISLYSGGGAHCMDPGGWDSGTVGLIWDTPEGRAMTGVELANVGAALEGEVREMASYVEGDVYGYRILDADGEELDSCWGYIGHAYFAEARDSAVEYLLETLPAQPTLEGV